MTENEIATVAIWSYGVATAVFVAFAVRLSLGWRTGRRAMLLLTAMVATAVWAGTGVVIGWRPGYSAWFAATAADALRYATWFMFLAILLKGDKAAVKPQTRPALPWGFAAAAAAALALSLVVGDGPPFTAVDDDGGRIVLYGAHLGLAILGLVLVEQLIRRVGPKGRWAIRPLCIGLAGVFAYDLYYFADAMLFGRLDADIWAARGIANALVIPFIAVATARNPGWTIELHLSRGAVFHSTAILVSGGFLLAVAGAGYLVRFLGGEWGRALQIELLFAALLVGILVVSSGSFRSKLRVFVSKHFFSYRYDYREEWLRFTRTLAAEVSQRGVQEQAIKALADLVESPGGALWLLRDDGAFGPASRWNLAAPEAVEPAQGSLPSSLDRTGWVIDLEEYAADGARYPDLDVPDWLAEMPNAWLVVPLVSGADLVGFAVLANSRAAIDVNWEIRDLLKVASRQAASYLGQIRASDALLEARKFEAFNRMSAFVVHDLKNLVAQLSLMLRNAERHRDNPEFQRDMLTTVQHVVGRMNHLMLQLRTGATPPEKPRLVDVEAIVRRVCAARAAPDRPIDLDLASGILALGHEDRLDHVIGHLVQNALDATTGGGDIRVRLSRDATSLVLKVTDSGIGMAPEFVRDRLFKPFETSKPSGMGIGVYESAQYIASLGGKILVDSKPDVGTCVSVHLPAGEDTLPFARTEADS